MSFLKVYYTSSCPNVKFSLYLKKGGLASRDIVHLQKNSFYVVSVSAFLLTLHFICEADQITTDPTYTSRIIVLVACLNILKSFFRVWMELLESQGSAASSTGSQNKQRCTLIHVLTVFNPIWCSKSMNTFFPDETIHRLVIKSF